MSATDDKAAANGEAFFTDTTRSAPVQDRVVASLHRTLDKSVGRPTRNVNISHLLRRAHEIRTQVLVSLSSQSSTRMADVERWLRMTDDITDGRMPQCSREEQYFMGYGWRPMNLHPKQLEFWKTVRRFIITPSGRRSGKTELGRRKFARRIVESKPDTDGRTRAYCLAGPTFAQSRKLFWSKIKTLFPRWMLADDPSDSQMRLKLLHNGTEVFVTGLDRPQRIEGVPLDGIFSDEFADIRAEAWPANIRPMLSETLGWAMFSGVPEGRNHYFDLYEYVQNNPDDEDWGVYHWTTEEILPIYIGKELADKELSVARRTMDEQTYKQEYLGSFEVYGGSAYYCFDRTKNAAIPIRYDKTKEIILCFDFNIAPGVCAIVQEQNLGTCVVDEIYFEKNSNTPKVVDEFIRRYGTHVLPIRMYGDSTGGSGGTAKVQGSDWDIIGRMMRTKFQDRAKNYVPRANGAERARVNAMNSRLKTADGTNHLYVSSACVHTIRDFESTLVKPDGSIDKSESQKMFSHITDAIGYYVVQRFPIAGGYTLRTSL